MQQELFAYTRWVSVEHRIILKTIGHSSVLALNP